MATRRGLEPLTSAVTGRHSNQLNYRAILTFIAVFLCELLSHEPASIVYYFKTILSTLFLKKIKKSYRFYFSRLNSIIFQKKNFLIINIVKFILSSHFENKIFIFSTYFYLILLFYSISAKKFILFF